MMLQEQQSLRKALVPKSAPVSVRSRSERAPQVPSTLCRATSNTDDDEGDVLWPLPANNNSHSSSPPSLLSHSPNSRSFMTSPRPHRNRAHTTDNVTFSRPVPAVLALRQVPKDPIQPKQGSIQDIHSSVAEADEGGEDGGNCDDWEIIFAREMLQKSGDSHRRAMRTKSKFVTAVEDEEDHITSKIVMK